MTKLPVLISIPHGGTEIPKELEGKICITPEDIFYDSDSFTSEIYDLRYHVFATIKNSTARGFVDANREITDLPPQYPDGIIKSYTCYNKKIYKAGKEPDQDLTEKLIDKYYLPYHDQIMSSIKNIKGIKFAIDCHSMADIGPEIARDKGKKRPVFCLGTNHGQSCSIETAEKFAQSLITVFKLKKNDVLIDNPFSGGYIVKNYGGNPLPWLQIEMNRSLYLSGPWFNDKKLEVTAERLKELKNKFRNTLELFLNINT